MTCKSYQKWVLCGVIFLTCFLAAYGYWIEPYRIMVRHVVIRDDLLYNSWGGLKVVHLSDLHITRLGRREEEVIRKLEDISPDIICVTGDLAQWDSKAPEVMKFLGRIKARYGVFVVLGDADQSIDRARCLFCHVPGNIHALRSRPIFLRNRLVSVSLAGSRRIQILGISPGMQEDRFPEFWKEVGEPGLKRGPLLVLSHFSSLWAYVPPSEPVLWLSGDTHGGQVRLPRFLWSILFKTKDYKHLKGLFSSGRGKWLYVSQGLGVTREFPFRIGVRPEIAVISFRPSKR